MSALNRLASPPDDRFDDISELIRHLSQRPVLAEPPAVFVAGPGHTTVMDVMEEAAKMAGIPLHRIGCRGRTLKHEFRARAAAVMVCREDLGYGFVQIGRRMKRDHSTIINAYRRGLGFYEQEPEFRDFIAELRRAVGL